MMEGAPKPTRPDAAILSQLSMKHCYLFILSLCSLLAHAQHPSPGGVGNDSNGDLLEFWFSVSSETYADGQLVSTVADLSGNGNPLGASSTGRPRPTFTAAGAGGNALPSLAFDGTTELESTYSGNSNNTMTFVTVLRRLPGTSTQNAVAVQHGGRNTVAFRDNTQRNFLGGADNLNNVTSPTNSWLIVSTDANPGSQTMRFYENGTAQGTVSYAIEDKPSNTWLGNRGSGGGDGYTGAVAETMKFSTVLNRTQQLLVNNYLSAKYDIPLAADNAYKLDLPTNGNYDHDVAGIGRISATDNHTDARSTGIVRMRNASGLDDNEFLMWGHDGQGVQTATNADVPAGPDGRFDRIWRVAEVDATGSTTVETGAVSVSFYPDPALGLTADMLRLLVDTDADGQFADEAIISGAVALGDGGFEFVGVTALEHGRRFALAVQQAGLPIKLEELSVSAGEGPAPAAHIEWHTAQEVDNDYFTVERSADHLNWKPVATVAGAGTAYRKHTYRVTDHHPLAGTSYYRLRQTDFDGSTTVSKVIAFRAAHEEAPQAYPNPTRHTVTVRTQAASLRVFDSLGREHSGSVLQHRAGETLSVDLSALPGGTYLLVAGERQLRVVKR